MLMTSPNSFTAGCNTQRGKLLEGGGLTTIPPAPCFEGCPKSTAVLFEEPLFEHTNDEEKVVQEFRIATQTQRVGADG